MNTTEFLSRVKSSITFPSYQARFSDADMLVFANEEQGLSLMEVITSLREEFFVFKEDVSIVAGTEKVLIPERAVGRTLRMVTANTDTDSPVPLDRIVLDNICYFMSSIESNPFGISWQDDYVYFRPVSSTDFTLSMYYMMAFSEIVPVADTCTITAVGNDTITVSKAPTTIAIGDLVDITRNKPGFRPVYIDQTVTNIAGNVITLSGFTVDDPIADVSSGYIISQAGETSILQMPNEAQTLLIKLTARRILQAQGMADGVKMLDDIIMKATRVLRNILAPRQENSNPAVVQYNGLLRGRTYGRGQRRMNMLS